MPMMTYFRMQLPSHGTGPSAPGHVSMPLPGVTPLSATRTRRRLAVTVQPPRAYLRATRYLPWAGFRPREARWTRGLGVRCGRSVDRGGGGAGGAGRGGARGPLPRGGDIGGGLAEPCDSI